MNRIVCVVLMIGLTLPALAQERRDVLLIDRAAAAATADVPLRGMSMQDVEQIYGTPLEAHDGVGTPPIVRWRYASFTVYFENRWVINSVINQISPDESVVPPPGPAD